MSTSQPAAASIDSAEIRKLIQDEVQRQVQAQVAPLQAQLTRLQAQSAGTQTTETVALVNAGSPTTASSAAVDHTASELAHPPMGPKAGYRLGDVTTRWWARAYKSTSVKAQIYQLREFTTRNYPGSITARHIELMNAVMGWSDTLNRSMVVLSQALDDWEEKRNVTQPHSHAQAAIHLRIGDGMSVVRQKPPPVARWAVLRGRVEHVHIVTGIHVDYGMNFLNQSVQYLREMRSALKDVGVHSTLRLAGAPRGTGDHGWDILKPEHLMSVGKSTAEEADEDFRYMVDAKEFIVGRGSFSFTIAEVRHWRGKPTWILQNETLGLDGAFPQVPGYLTVIP